MFLSVISPIVFAAVVATALGFLWYSPLMFGNIWMKLNKISKRDTTKECSNEMGKLMAINAILTLLKAFIIYILVLTNIFFLPGIIAVWLGFSLPVYADVVLWDRKPWKLFFINAGFGLVSITFMAEIIRLWVY